MLDPVRLNEELSKLDYDSGIRLATYISEADFFLPLIMQSL